GSATVAGAGLLGTVTVDGREPLRAGLHVTAERAGGPADARPGAAEVRTGTTHVGPGAAEVHAGVVEVAGVTRPVRLAVGEDGAVWLAVDGRVLALVPRGDVRRTASGSSGHGPEVRSPMPGRVI